MENELTMLENLTLLEDRVLISVLPKEKSTSKLIIEDTTQIDVLTGIVVCLGDTTKYVKPLSKVLIPAFTGRIVTLDGKDYVVLKEEVIIGIL